MVRAMLSVLNTLVLVLLGSLDLLVTCSSAIREKKVHDKRQAASLMFYPQQNRVQSQYPAYFPSPGYYQYNPSLKNSGHTMQPLALPQQQPFDASSPYSQTSRAQPHGRYTSYFYPHRTHFKDWSQKVLQASNYARKWQTARKQELLLRNQNANQGGGGIKVFAAGIDKNGNMQSKWVGQAQFQEPSDGKIYPTMNVGTLSNSPPNSKSIPQLVANPPTSHSPNQQGNPVSPYTNFGIEPVSRTQQTQTSSFHDKATKANANSNQAIFSDNLGGAVLGPNAHSLLQWAASQKAPDSSSPENHLGGVGSTGNNNKNTNLFPDTNVPSNKVFGQKQSENILSDNEHHTSVNMLSVQGNSNSQSLMNPLSSSHGTNLPTKQLGQMTSGKTTGVTNNAVKNLPSGTRNMDKTTVQMLNSRLTSISASRPQSESTSSQRSASNATPKNNEVATRNSALGETSSNESMINSELALKNILFPPPSTTRNQLSGSTRKNLTPQQIVPSFPAFRYDENGPATDQQPNYKIYPRDKISHPLIRKSLVPRTKPVPYKGSFPLMLHKISPYFKMKRNLKRMANGQAKARRRFLELQNIKR